MRGNIRQRAKNSWTITIELPKDEITNRRKQKYYTVKGNKKEAEKFLTEKLRELDTGLLINTKKMKFGEYLDYWRDKTFNNLEITTKEGYIQKIDKHIKPYLANILLENLKPLHLQNFYEEKLKNGKLDGKGGLSARTVLALHRIIHSALEQAVKWQLVIRNVAEAVEPPKAKRYKANFLTDKQTEELITTAQNTDIYIPIMIAIFTGARRGEILGLNWDNVDLEKGTIKIVDNLCATKNGLIIKQPKTDSGIRTIAISESLVKILKKHKISQIKNKIRLGKKYEEHNMVCCYGDGHLFNPKRFSAKFNELLQKNNLPMVRFHDLRHSHASLLVKMGVQPKEISSRLGHSNIGITMDLYSHLYEETDREVANMFEKLINIKNG